MCRLAATTGTALLCTGRAMPRHPTHWLVGAPGWSSGAVSSRTAAGRAGAPLEGVGCLCACDSWIPQLRDQWGFAQWVGGREAARGQAPAQPGRAAGCRLRPFTLKNHHLRLLRPCRRCSMECRQCRHGRQQQAGPEPARGASAAGDRIGGSGATTWRAPATRRAAAARRPRRVGRGAGQADQARGQQHVRTEAKNTHLRARPVAQQADRESVNCGIAQKPCLLARRRQRGRPMQNSKPRQLLAVCGAPTRAADPQLHREGPQRSARGARPSPPPW